MMGGRQSNRTGYSTSFRSNDTFLKSTYCGRSTASSILRACGPTWRPSIDPELLMRMLILGYCFGIGSERRLCEEVDLNLAYRWFCRLGLDGCVPDHSTFSKTRHGRFRDSDAFRHLFEIVVQR